MAGLGDIVLTFGSPLKDETGGALAARAGSSSERAAKVARMREWSPDARLFDDSLDLFEGVAGYNQMWPVECWNWLATTGLERYFGDRNGFQTSDWMIVHPRLCPLMASCCKAEAGGTTIVEPADP